MAKLEQNGITCHVERDSGQMTLVAELIRLVIWLGGTLPLLVRSFLLSHEVFFFKHNQLKSI